MVNLRLYITLAKLQHLESDWMTALQYWTQAFAAINQFPPTSGLATRTIHLSICNMLHQQSDHEMESRSRNTVAILEDLCQTSEAKHWIAGLGRWLEFLKSRPICKGILQTP